MATQTPQIQTQSVEPSQLCPSGDWTSTVEIIHAHQLEDAFVLLRMIRSNRPVLLNCRALTAPLAQRLIDICSGGVNAMDGQTKLIGPGVVLFAPALSTIAVISDQTADCSSANCA